MKRNLLILLTVLLLSCSLAGCRSEETIVKVNVDNTDGLYGNNVGSNALIPLGNGLYYDSTTRIVYWWNGYVYYGGVNANNPSPYYAPNGLPYKYNPETNTFEEIEVK